MKKKTRLLMQLRDCISGYAGITQETQLLFATLLDSSILDASGLMMKYDPYNLQTLPRGIPAHLHNSLKATSQNLKHLSDFIIGYKADGATNQSSLSLLDKLYLPFRILYLNTLTTLGRSIPVDHFDGQGFENFLWECFFSSILTADEFKKVTRASFRTMPYPVNFMHIAGLMAIRYPKLDTREYDIFLAQTPFPGRVAKNTQLVIRYHDAIPMFAPHLMSKPKFQQTFHYNALKSNAKNALFACVSHAARNDLLCLFPSLEKRSVVIHDLVSDHFFKETDSRHSLIDIVLTRTKGSSFLNKDLHAPFKYLLVVSRIEPRKNHIRTMQAWERVRLSQQLNLKLIFVGKLDCDQGLMDAIKPWQERGELIHLHNVTMPELRFLYQEAACVICPSVMEGFDLSGIEAMLCGGKVAASNIPVHHEVYGDAAVYFDPYSIEDQVRAIESIVSSENASFATEISDKGHTWATQYQRSAVMPHWENFFIEISAGKFKICG